MAPLLHGKIVKWLRDNGYLGNLPKTLRVKIKSTVPLKAEVHTGVEFHRNAVTAAQSEVPNVVPVKSVPPRRRTKSDAQVLKHDEVIFTSTEMINNNVTDKCGRDLPKGEGCSSEESFGGIKKVIALIIDSYATALIASLIKGVLDNQIMSL